MNFKWIFLQSLFLMIVCLSLSSFTLLKREIKIRSSELTYRELFREVERQTGIITIFNDDAIYVDVLAEIKTGTFKLKKLYDLMSRKGNFSYEVDDNYIVVKEPQRSTQKNKKINVAGIIKNEKGETLPGVSIWIKGTKDGTITDINGKYNLKVNKGDVLVVSFVGMKKIEKTVGGFATFFRTNH